MASFLNTDTEGVSLFDIFAEDSLRSSLKPAWDFVCKFLASKYPRHMMQTLKYSDEIYYLFLLLMEEYNLRKSAASMTETFYQLKRESSASPSSFMFRHAKTISLISVVILPYFLSKLEKRYQRIKESNDVTLTSFDAHIYNWYPTLKSFSKWLRMLNYLLYLFKYTRHAFPLMILTNIQLKYDLDSKPTTAPSTEANAAKDWLLSSLLTKPLDMVSYSFTKLVPVVFYSLSFLDTFYDQETWTQNPWNDNVAKMSPPDIPKIMSSVRMPTSKKLCPICHKSRESPSTLPVSGFVFCYACVHNYVQRHGCCPVTYRPCQVKDIIRIHSTK